MPSSAGNIFAALSAAWTAASASLGDFKGPYRDSLPADKNEDDFPYVIFNSISNRFSFYSSHNEYWGHQFQFIVRDRTPELVEQHIGVIGDVFDPIELTITPGTIVNLRRVDEIYTEEGKSIYKGAIVYEVTRSKPR